MAWQTPQSIYILDEVHIFSLSVCPDIFVNSLISVIIRARVTKFGMKFPMINQYFKFSM